MSGRVPARGVEPARRNGSPADFCFPSEYLAAGRQADQVFHVSLVCYPRYSLLPTARDYLEQERLSYQRTVAPGGRVIRCVTPQGQEQIDERH